MGKRFTRELEKRNAGLSSSRCRLRHLLFPLGRRSNRIGLWRMTISQTAGVTGTSGYGE
jgi:hypothetical protein